jgi:hypothetical protein
VEFEGTESQGESTGTTEVTGGAPIESTAGGESNSTGYNPVWDEAFSAIPDVPEFKDKLRPVFEKWDSNNNSRYEKVQQEFAPYRPLLENNVPFDDIQAAFELRNQIASNPQEIFGRLAQHLGYDVSGLVAPDRDEESQGQYSEDEDDDPRISKLAKENEEIKSYLQRQAQEQIDQQNAIQQEQQEREYYNSTVETLNSLEERYGKFDRNKAVQFAIWEAETNGTEVDLESGFRAMKAFQGQAIQESANSSAPDVFSGNGSLVSGRVDTSKMSDAEFQKYAVERMKAKLENQG